MNELPSSLWIVLGVIAGLQVMLLFQIARLSGRVGRLDTAKSSPPPTNPQDTELAEQKSRSAEQKQWFAVFLEEDPSRRELPKKEQFEAFRRWRSERGLNWRAPDE